MFKINNIKYSYRLGIRISAVIVVLSFYLASGVIFNQVSAQNTFNDDFNSYTLDLLDGQGNWTTFFPNGGLVVDSPVLEGSRAVNFCSTQAYACGTTKTIPTPVSTGTIYYYLKFYKSNSDYVSLGDAINLDLIKIAWTVDQVENEVIFKFFNGVDWTEIKRINYNPDVWVKMGVNWDSTTGQFKFFIDNEWTETFEIYAWFNDPVDRLTIVASCGEYGNTSFIDFINSDSWIFDEPIVWGISPVSGTEITDLNSSLIIGYMDFEGWDSLYVNLKNLETGIFTGSKIYEISEIGSEGTLTINLQDFNIEKNANWFLNAVGVYEGFVYEGGFLSGVGYNLTEDLTDGNYFLDINIDGLDPFFTVSDFNSWYSENVDKFDEPTLLFRGIAGLFAPIFGILGEFGNRIVGYFEIDQSYTQGYEIGKSIPMFSYYVGQISVFLGGFPIINWALILILILVGIFIFRIIIKFIPFLGG